MHGLTSLADSRAEPSETAARRRLALLNVIDEFAREAQAIHVDHSIVSALAGCWEETVTKPSPVP